MYVYTYIHTYQHILMIISVTHNKHRYIVPGTCCRMGAICRLARARDAGRRLLLAAIHNSYY